MEPKINLNHSEHSKHSAFNDVYMILNPLKKYIIWGQMRVMRELFYIKTYAKKNFESEKADGGTWP